jgi:hypothetical protein
MIVLPLVMAVVLCASATAKLRRPDDLAGWAEMGVPSAFRRSWILRLHPWAELVLGLALAALGGWLGLLAALACVALMAAYSWLVWRTLRNSPGAACACFGSVRPVTGVTLTRNVWLLLLSVGAAALIGSNPLLGGALASVETGEWGWVIGAAVAAVTAVLILWPDESVVDASSASTPAHAIDAGEDLDYIRTRTPAVPVMLADGTTVNLRKLAAERPILILAVSETCGSCRPVIDKIGEWRELLPEVDIRFLSRLPPGTGVLTDATEPQSLHDPDGYVRGSIADWPTPTAVLLGIDGMLAGGPVSGHDDISEFIADVYESLHGERPPHSSSGAGVRL